MTPHLSDRYKVRWTTAPGVYEEQEFNSKEDNDAFAKTMELMPVKNIFKMFYNPHIGNWYRYHNESAAVLRNAGD